ncbi:hypothetical protein BDZ97DRAFT_1639961, partial [Flammula alnicola]
WSKYVECNKAIKLGKSLVENGKWAEDLPRFNENLIIEVFIGKSAWHANYTKNFSAVQTKYPDMVDWLESETSTKEEDVKVWGVYKKDYVFSDLKELVDNGGKLKVKKKKKKHSSSEDEGTGKGKQPQRRSLLLICLGLVSLLEYLGLSLLWSLLCLMSAVLPVSATLPLYMKLLVFAIFLPLAAAVPQTQAFPDIPFKVFSAFVENTFSSEVSLATVLLVLFSMTENTELLNLHARQQIPEFDGENRTLATGWIRAFSRAIMHKMKRDVQALFLEREFPPTRYHQVTKLSTKLDAFAKLLNLTPYDDENNFKTKLLPVSYDAIQAVQTLCPDSMFCMNAQCDPRALLQATKTTDIPLVTLIKDNTVYQDVPVLTGKCNTCDTTYHADHERFKDGHGLWNKCYLNSARYLKVGQSTWVDRKFSHTVLSGMYDFHASAAAYTQFWNDSTSVNSSDFQITRRQIWQTFIQESVRMVASTRKTNLELRENLNINEVTKEAYSILGNTGILEDAKDHACSQCSQPYKANADSIVNTNVAHADPNAMDVDYAPVKMVVLDGIVMGPVHCAYEKCTADLKNARGGAFCNEHEILFGNNCRVGTCQNTKVDGTQACRQHQSQWRKYKLEHSRSSMAGVRRMLQRPTENLPWQPNVPRPARPHDNDDEEDETPRTHYFGPSRFYCVETICAPCGVVIAWTKFDKSESPTKILNFLGSVYPTADSRPNYICIDKACKVLRTSIANKSWDTWQKTSRFIVDSYHYINHRTTDYLCRKWCNPAPLNGSAPNLVKVAKDKNGKLYLQRAFNTQACEQLNAWLGGFESILKRMTSGNFDWFLHAMLVYHTQQVIRKQEQKKKPVQIQEIGNEEEDEEEE